MFFSIYHVYLSLLCPFWMTCLKLLYDRGQGRWWEVKWPWREGTLGGSPKLLLGPNGHEDQSFMHKVSYCKGSIWFQIWILWCFEMTLWPPLIVDSTSQNWSLANMILEVGWFSVHSITLTHAIFFMLITKGEVLTCGFSSIDYEGASEVDVDGLGDKWDGFQFWENGTLDESVAYNGITLIWSLMMTFFRCWPSRSSPRGGSWLSLTYETYGIRFCNQCWIFYKAQKIP